MIRDPLNEFDIAIVGAGIAGASCAYFVAPHRRVLILERESQPGYHSSGRSAAAFIESYGNRPIRAATRASRAFLQSPPTGFSEHALLRPRACIVMGGEQDTGALHEAYEEQRQALDSIRPMDREALYRAFPALKPDQWAAGFVEPNAADIDVHALLQGYLRGAQAAGARLVTGAEVTALARREGLWQIDSTAGQFQAHTLVNAAGAWASPLAALAGASLISIEPRRRTAITFEVPEGAATRDWPMVVDVNEQFYIKPDAGRMMASPADESPSPPVDAQPEELDIAITVDRVESATLWQIRRLASRWAGLRSFAADRTIVCGPDPQRDGFFWLAGQGGYGVQTSPAMGMLACALLTGQALPAALAEVDPDDFAASRASLR